MLLIGTSINRSFAVTAELQIYGKRLPRSDTLKVGAGIPMLAPFAAELVDKKNVSVLH